MPRSSADQADHVRRIKKRDLRPGDFLFFHDDGAVYHVAVFLKRRDGEVRMVHAPGSGERVRRDSPWTKRWFAGTLRRR
jgi:cell wall-associated NlpC family hydrolase